MGREKKLPPGMHKRGDTYYARFVANGRLIRRRLSKDLDAAKLVLKELRSRADKGSFGIVDNDYPWDELRKEFLGWARQAVRNPREYERDIEHFEKYLHPRTVGEITSAAVVGFRAWRMTQGAMRKPKRQRGRQAAPPVWFAVTARTINREVGTLQNLLNRAVEWGKIASNPITGLKPLKHDTRAKERRALTVAEVEAILAASPAHLRPIWRTFLVTGIRHEELIEMRFSDIDWDRQTVTVQASTAKNHKAREIPLDDELFEAIKALKEQAAARQPMPGATVEYTRRQAKAFSREHVFVTKMNTPWRNNLLARFYAVCQRAGIEDARPGGAVDIHSLRVSFTTLALDHGANPRAVQALLGHATLGLTMTTYAKATERAKRDAVAALPFATSSGPNFVFSVRDRRKDGASRGELTQRVVNE